MKITKAPKDKRPRPQTPAVPFDQLSKLDRLAVGLDPLLGHKQELTRACQELLDQLVERKGLDVPVALARVVAEVYFIWAPSIIDFYDRKTGADFNNEMGRIAVELKLASMGEDPT